jgi:Subtilase family
VAGGYIINPESGSSLMRTRFLFAVALSLACFALPAAADAATPAVTAQAQAANAAFLAYAPAPAHGPGALCLVDTGVHANPDTSPGLVSATALDGGSGEDVDPQGHGTTMAMIAGAAGNGMVGAWPQLKIVSVRATGQPSPGQEPTFEFNDYWEGIQQCLEHGSLHVDAIDLALSSTIPPSPDQAQKLQTAVAQANTNNVAIVAAAGNTPGAVEEPAAESGIFAVGAFTAQPDQTSGGPEGSICSFSATQGLTFYAPGCGLDEAEPFTDQPSCCGNGTSQASAFTGAVLTALMSYDPTLTYSHAEQLLVSTATDGDLNVAAAFGADGLGSVVAAGNANIPKPPASAPATPAAATPAPQGPGAVVLRLLRWRRGVLRIRVAQIPAGGRLHVQLEFAHGFRRVISKRSRLRVHTSRPRAVQLRLVVGKADGPVLEVKMRK